MQIIDVRLEKNPWNVAVSYVKGHFITDIIAVMPWSVIRPQFIFLRYLKLRKFGVYQAYFDEFLSELSQGFLNNE
jgi:hypothetical protein